MDIINFIPYGQREIRLLISQARRHTVILNLQDGNGYFRPTDEEINLVERFKQQEQSRAKKIFWSLRGCNEFIKEKGYAKTN